jgi:hypothetical protein
MEIHFLQVLSAGLLISGLAHLVAPGETERLMSEAANVRAAGAMLLIMIVPSVVFRFYLLGFLLGAFGLPRLLAPERSIQLQQRLYPRRVHGVLLVAGAVGLWLFSRSGLAHR